MSPRSHPQQTKPRTVHTGYRYRLEVLPHQAQRLESLAGACRWAWNHFLHYREDAYLAARAAGGALPKGAFSYVANAAEVTRLRKSLPWLKAADATGLQQTLRDLDAAYAKFFAGKCGHPRPRRRDDARYRVCGQASFGVEGDWVRLPKLGWVRFRKSRDLPAGGRILNVTVSREGAAWFVSFCVEHALAAAAVPAGEPVGLDLGVTQSVAFSDDTPSFQMRVPTKRERGFLVRLHRQVSRKAPGSVRHRKAVARLGERRAYHARCVRDDAHKLTSHLANTRREVHAEDLRLRNMTASAKGSAEAPGKNVRAKAGLNRSLLANAHAQTLRLLAYKCERSGTQLALKNPAHTSQECAECHHIAPENRPSQARFACVKCGHTDNADHNAARVILARPTGGRSVAVRRGQRKTTRNGRRPDEAQTQLRDQELSPPGSTGIPAKALAA
jgi:putative transposase